jgi:hypothetical protein
VGLHWNHGRVSNRRLRGCNHRSPARVTLGSSIYADRLTRA